MAIKHKKTHYKCFSPKQPDISLKDCQVIAEVTSSKVLIIDDKMNLRDHVSFVCRKVSRGLGVIIKARKVLKKSPFYVCIIHLYILIWYIATRFWDLPVKHI